jgi:DNA-binding HxlR family transcriptional regulator
MGNKTYGQLCPIARSLDILGDRWTLLLIRELLLGPKRFKDLLAMLPAMGTNRLSERLAMLVDSGVIRPATLSAAAAAPAYELTELGEQLRKPLLALGLWGLKLPADERADPSSARAELIALCLTGVADPTASAGLHEVVEFQVGAETFHLRITDGDVLARSGAPAEPDLQVQCDLDTFMALALRQITPSSALRNRQVKLLRGSQQAFTRVFRILEPRP